jgi:hypothetical protein
MNTPRLSIHTSRTKLAGILIAIASPEKPVYAITTPAGGYASHDGESAHPLRITTVNQQSQPVNGHREAE